MKRIESQLGDQEDLAKQVLSWITHAKRPLTMMELQYALAVGVGESALDQDNLPYIEDMVSVCAGLVTIDEGTGIIRLVHYTTQEYFERTQKRWFPNAKTDITTICLAYLSFKIFESGFCESDEAFEERILFNPLYDYAANNWGNHARDISHLCYGMIDFLVSLPKVEASSQAVMAVKRLSARQYSQDVPRQVVGLHLAAYFGVKEAVYTLLKHWRVEVCDSHDQTPLLWAVRGGHEAVVQLLLDKGADIEARDHSGRTALWMAAKHGHKAVVQLLLDKGANIEARNHSGQVALSSAAQHGHEAVVQLLLEKGANIQARNHSGQTALLWAAENGHEAVVRLLLKNGADMELKNTQGECSLHICQVE